MARLDPGAAALAGLAAQVDTLARRLDGHDTALDELRLAVTGAVEAAKAAMRAFREPLPAEVAAAALDQDEDQLGPCPDWFTIEDPDAAGDLLAGLTEWTGAVWSAYGPSLRRCWTLHPAAVAELLGAWWAHQAALQGPPAGLADWHERHRPGVEKRVGGYLGGCTDTAHTTEHRGGIAPGVLTGPLDPAAIGAWWARTRGAEALPGIRAA